MTVESVSKSYIDAKIAQEFLLRVLVFQHNAELKKIQIEAFEDVMNELSGDIQNLDESLLNEIQSNNSALVDFALEGGSTVSLHDTVVLPADRKESNEIKTVLAKKLYPRTESVQVGGVDSSNSVDESTDSNTDFTEDNVESNEPTIEYGDESLESIDSIFNDIDEEAEAAANTYTPIAMEQTETLPYIPDGMIELAEEAAANANGLQAGLVAFSTNPIAEVVDDTIELLLYYTADNYANLNVALSGVYS